MIVDQQRAVQDQARISSERKMVMLTRDEWRFLQHYRQCTPADQDLIFRALSGDAEAVNSLARRP